MAFAWQNWHFVSCVQLFNKEKVDRYLNKYELFAGWEVRMEVHFTIRTDP